MSGTSDNSICQGELQLRVTSLFPVGKFSTEETSSAAGQFLQAGVLLDYIPAGRFLPVFLAGVQPRTPSTEKIKIAEPESSTPVMNSKRSP